MTTINGVSQTRHLKIAEQLACAMSATFLLLFYLTKTKMLVGLNDNNKKDNRYEITSML